MKDQKKFFLTTLIITVLCLTLLTVFSVLYEDHGGWFVYAIWTICGIALAAYAVLGWIWGKSPRPRQ